ncbi:hypothetical protein [Rhodoblastus sp.]|uniref:hyaluronate lyase N-terminal domain-containing protein n=1 Tax=Rhodoblastus sp. TaxID=1962975 RepID=UPI00261DC816|nr:hypothetical protein [Rhodoblastus sp.]
MSVQVKRRRDTAANVAAYTGAQGELIVDTTNNRVTVHDGVTPGGWAAAKLSEVLSNARTTVSDANYTVLSTDRMVAMTAITAARTFTLPAASAYPTGTRLVIVDESGGCSSLNRINVTPNGTDTIDGVNATALVNQPYGYLALESNGLASGNGKWTILDQPTGMIPTQPLAQGPNGAAIQCQVIEQTVTLSSGTSVTAATPIPANCILLGVGYRVVTAITGAPAVNVGTSGNATQFGGSLGVAAGSTNYGLIGPAPFYSPTSILVASTGASFTGGQVRLSIHVLLISPPTS